MTDPEPRRALSFGRAAEGYERHRGGYPDGLVDAVLRHARRPVRSALEVGAGTGKATRLFAAGCPVTALEPDPEMVRVLERTTAGLPVTPLVTTFERYDGAGRYDLLYAAAAWHWTDPATRWSRAVALLEPGGVLALFGCPDDPRDPSLAAAVAAVEREVLPAGDAGAVHGWTVADVAAVAGLTDAVQRDLPRATLMTREAFLARVGTVSSWLLLDGATRAAALARLGGVLPDRFEVDTTVRLTLARRA